MAYQGVFIIMTLVWVITLVFPWHNRTPSARLVMHLPWLLVALEMTYEMLMPEGVNIRVDLFLIVPATALSFLLYATRLAIFASMSKPPPEANIAGSDNSMLKKVNEP